MSIMQRHFQSIRATITMQVLECAKDAGDVAVIAACRRCIVAWRNGEKAPADFALVMQFHNAGR